MIKSDRERAKKIQEINECKKIIDQNRALLTRIGLPKDKIEANLQPTVAILEGLDEEVREYDALTNGSKPPQATIEGIGDLLVKLRIYKRLTQKALAEKIGVDETQVSRDERNRYKGVSLERLLKVVHALEVQVNCTVNDEIESQNLVSA